MEIQSIRLELSVISNKRTPSNKTSEIKTPSIYKDIISRIYIDKNSNHEVFSGVELKVTIESEFPRSIETVNAKKEQFIHILSGMVTITTIGGKTQVFYTGDFLVLPKGFSGKWESKGQNQLKTIKVYINN